MKVMVWAPLPTTEGLLDLGESHHVPGAEFPSLVGVWMVQLPAR